MDLNVLQSLHHPSDTRVVLLVLDGLGGLPRERGGPTELEAAHTPHLDELAAGGICGLHVPVASGVTPGSGPSHLALFGYDPLEYRVGRGVLAALGIDFDLRPGDVAARGNFCTVDEAGRVVDRRAGRIPTAKNRELCEHLRDIEVPGVKVFLRPVKEYRFLLVLRGEGLSGEVTDTDPQRTGVAPLSARPRTSEAAKTAARVRTFVDRAREILAGRHPANMVLLRGFSQRPSWPSVETAFGLKGIAIAAYPMYRGLARLLGMSVLEVDTPLESAFDALEANWSQYDFYFVHTKPTDSAGEDGDFDRKVALIEAVDGLVPRLTALEPDVVVVTGDHSSPAALRAHSWHPVPVLLWSPHCRPDRVGQFGERACAAGGLGPQLPASALMPIALANALRLKKFGA